MLVKNIAPKETVQTPPWWINPLRYCAFFLLPFFLLTVFMAGPYMDKLGQRVNNLTPEYIGLGLASIVLFTIGALPFSVNVKIQAPQEYSVASINRALTFLGTLSLLCNLIYFFPLLLDPGLVLTFFSGGIGRSQEIRHALGQIPGITSFISACLPFFALYSAVTMEKNLAVISRYNRRLLLLLFMFVAARAILGSERLALVEAAVAYGVPRAVFVWKRGALRTWLPFIGVGGVFGLFCVGEYFRSWQYYQAFYSNFIEFITVRFFGYFATSINNGAGVVKYYEPYDEPYQTLNGVYSLFSVFGINLAPPEDFGVTYLAKYATPEFNNPGGLYVPYMDFGIIGGLLVFLLVGGFTGWLYKSFLSRKAVGLLLYPSWFLALLDILRVWIWGASRFVPVLIVVAVALSLVKRKELNKKPYF